jgi:hypothetical protein
MYFDVAVKAEGVLSQSDSNSSSASTGAPENASRMVTRPDPATQDTKEDS